MGKFTLPTPEELGLSPADYGDLLHGLPPWAGGWDDDASSESGTFDAPKIEGESDHLHLVHYSGCQDDGRELIQTWCAIAVEESGAREDAEVAAVEKPICPACLAVVRASTICPICNQDAA